MPRMSLEDLRDEVSGGAVAIRGKALLEPAGGPGDKVFPPSHSVGERNKDRGAKYAREERRFLAARSSSAFSSTRCRVRPTEWRKRCRFFGLPRPHAGNDVASAFCSVDPQPRGVEARRDAE